ncbi:MAG: squalene/phytoene synthase family protein [Alcaligenaceae bacterium]|nr:squalene/phytoene synthase family protein [Alcaligenaceae bacterium]
MTPLDYCATKSNRPTSSIYYALLTAPDHQRPHLIALLALHKEINEVLIECQEASVARVKLAWWRAELEHTLEGKPNHPISKALLTEGSLVSKLRTDPNAVTKIYQLFSELIDAAELDLSQGRYLDWPNLERYLQLNAVALGKLLAWQLLGDDYIVEKHEPVVAHLAKGIALSIIVRDVGLHSIQGRIYIPMSDLRQFNVTAHQMQQRQYGDNFKALFDFEVQAVMDFFKAAQTELKQLPQDDIRRLRPLLSLATMHKELLHKLSNNPQSVFEHRINLSPLRKAWIAQKHNFSFNRI